MDMPNKTIKIGISACLMGQNVRYNAGHSKSKLCLSQLSKVFEFTSFCPEMAAGFGAPRPIMRLAGKLEQPALIYSEQSHQQADLIANDLSPKLLAASTDTLKQAIDFDGYILMKNSPSCGLFRVKVYPSAETKNPVPEKNGRGVFAHALCQQYPNLPIEEEGRLHDPHLRENFILRVYVHHNFRQQVLSQDSYHALLDFHSRHKYLLMAHNQNGYKAIGRFLAKAHDLPIAQAQQAYLSQLMQALSKPATKLGHSNVLQHILGYLKRALPGPVRQQIVQTIEDYRQGILPLSAPITLLQHYIEQSGNDYIRQQMYWQPYPSELKLRRNL